MPSLTKDCIITLVNPLHHSSSQFWPYLWHSKDASQGSRLLSAAIVRRCNLMVNADWELTARVWRTASVRSQHYHHSWCDQPGSEGKAHETDDIVMSTVITVILIRKIMKYLDYWHLYYKYLLQDCSHWLILCQIYFKSHTSRPPPSKLHYKFSTWRNANNNTYSVN